MKFTTDLLNDPFFIGADRIFERVRQNTTQSNYPPYNIVKVDEDNYAIELAVAGFTFDDLSIEVKEGILYVNGNKKTTDEGEYLHKGISARSFQRSFTLSDTIVVGGADLDNGILTIDLENVIPEEKKPRKIDIGSGKSKKSFLTE